MVMAIIIAIRFFHRIGKPVDATLSDSYYYHARKNIVVHSPMANWFELGYNEMDADPATFKVLSREFGMDQFSVYWKGKKQQVDRATFKVDENKIPKDAVHVYFERTYKDQLVVVEGADPESYHPLSIEDELVYQRWYKDKYAVYANGQKLNVDPKTFTRINSTLAADSFHLYSVTWNEDSLEVLQQAANQGGTFIALSENYVRNDNRIILSNWKNKFSILSFTQIDSVRVINDRNLVVNSEWISDGRLVEGLDVDSWVELGRDHFKDKNSVYYDGHKIKGADPGTFKVVYEDYSKDARYVYYKYQVLKNAQPETFEYQYNKNMATDGKLHFRDGIPVNP